MSVTRNPARPCAGAPAYSPDNLPVYGGGSSAATPISCAFPLDASEPTVQGFGFTGRLVLSNDDQTGQRTITGTNGEYAAISGTSQQIAADSGKKAVQWNIDQIDAVASGTGSWFARLVFYSLGFTDIYQLRVIADSAGTFSYESYLGGVLSYSVSGVGSPPSELGVTFDASASEIKLRIDGTLRETVSYTPQALGPAMSVAQVSHDVADDGSIVRCTWVTLASSITQADSGATDVCGNSI